MKTFHISVENLGPIRFAEFDASHFNVLCGKNNSGKSFLLHTIYCLLSYWRYLIPFTANKEHLDAMLATGKTTVDIWPYIETLNGRIAASMNDFVSQLPGLLCKNPAGFLGAGVGCEVDMTYADRIFRGFRYDWNYDISANAMFHIQKNTGDTVVQVELVNKTGVSLNEDVVLKTFQYVLSLMSHAVLPMPLLLTAERAGSIMFGEDVLASNFRSQQESLAGSQQPPHRYPYPLIQEIQYLQNIKRGLYEARGNLTNTQCQAIYSNFVDRVSGGEFTAENGVLYYRQGQSLPLNVEECSTSVKSLAGIDYFVKSVMHGSSLLMIDEPELNLHPERQRSLTRLLARVVTLGGAGVAISTHSDYITREINTLLALGALRPRSDALCAKYGYVSDELLSSDFVACGIVDHGHVNQVDVSGGRGLCIPGFDATNDAINQVQDAIFELG